MDDMISHGCCATNCERRLGRVVSAVAVKRGRYNQSKGADMRRGAWKWAALLFGLALLPAFGAKVAVADTVKIAHSTWVGYGPLYIARDKGFFKKNGVDVDLMVMEDPKERFPTLMADRIQMIASTVDTALLYLKKPTDFQYVVAIDDSNGGDGIVAIKDIKTHRRSEGQEGRGQRRLGVGILPERAAGQGRAEGIRPQHGEHDRGRCRRCVRRQAGRCRGDVGAMAEPRARRPISVICWSTAPRRPA